MKPFVTFFFSFVVWCCLCTSAFSQLGNLKIEDSYPSSFYSPEDVLQAWIRIHYDVYGEDVSGEPWARDLLSFWRHAVSSGAEPPYYWAISPHPHGFDSAFPFSIDVDGIDFLGVWPVYLIYSRSGYDPSWCTLQNYLDLLYRGPSFTNAPNLVGTVMQPMLEWFDRGEPSGYVSNDFRSPLWGIILYAENTETHSNLGYSLPFTRVYLRLPYYPAWWALGGSYYALSYDDGYDLFYHETPWYEYDGYVFYSTNRVKLRQVVKWTSP